jgi:quinol monooxygenase YgiN
MIRLFVRHKVAHFATWKKGYDGFEATRKRLGVKDAAVFRGAPDPNDVTVWSDFESLAAAQAFLEAPELASAMKQAGVSGKPEAWFVERELPR